MVLEGAEVMGTDDRLLGAIGARLDGLESTVKDLVTTVERLKERQVPPWLWGIVGPIAAVFLSHYVK